MKDENYVVIHGWMKNKLGLKGNELFVYALVYGYSQDGESEFGGSMSYIADVLDVSKPTAIKTVKSLVEKNLISKRSIEMNGVIFNRYKAVSDFTGGKEILHSGKKTLPPPSKEILPNNNIYINNNKDNIYSSVIDSLNTEAGTNYKPSSDKTRRLIDARLGDGFGEEDFKTVIKKKCAAWKGTEMAKYLRPETLFGTKFEGYLNELESKPKPKNTFSDFGQRNYDYDDLQKKLGGA